MTASSRFWPENVKASLTKEMALDPKTEKQKLPWGLRTVGKGNDRSGWWTRGQ